MGIAAQPPRANRTITVDFRSEATSFQRRGDGKACREGVLAFVLSLGFQLTHQATCRGGGGLTRHSPDTRVRVNGVTIWRLPCTPGKAVCTVWPHVVLRSRPMPPDVARAALLATQGGLSLAWWAGISHLSPMARYRLICALGQQRVGTVLTRWRLPLPVDVLADEQHRCCLTEHVSLPTIVRGRVRWPLG